MMAPTPPQHSLFPCPRMVGGGKEAWGGKWGGARKRIGRLWGRLASCREAARFGWLHPSLAVPQPRRTAAGAVSDPRGLPQSPVPESHAHYGSIGPGNSVPWVPSRAPNEKVCRRSLVCRRSARNGFDDLGLGTVIVGGIEGCDGAWHDPVR
jgi:hypothetical protein